MGLELSVAMGQGSRWCEERLREEKNTKPGPKGKKEGESREREKADESEQVVTWEVSVGKR